MQGLRAHDPDMRSAIINNMVSTLFRIFLKSLRVLLDFHVNSVHVRHHSAD